MKLEVKWRGEAEGVDKSKVVKEMEAVVKEQGVKGKLEIGVSWISEKKMVKLNQKYMGKKEVTDVLAFPLEKEKGPDKVMRLGDVVICLDQAAKQAKVRGISQEEEVVFLVRHGMLHLLGIHHK